MASRHRKVANLDVASLRNLRYHRRASEKRSPSQGKGNCSEQLKRWMALCRGG